jgi:hypothetical protein
MTTIKVAPYFQPLKIRKGGIVSHHTARGGLVTGRIVESLESRSAFARAYGVQVSFTDGASCCVVNIVTYEPPRKLTPSGLRAELLARNSESRYFSRENMRFFGDTMRNYGVRLTTINGGVQVFELYRRKPVKHGLQSSAYFLADTFARTRIES